MNEDDVGIAVMFLILIFIGCYIFIGKGTCDSRWEGSTYQTDWSMLGGCRVKVGDKFLPEANVREIER